jgi:RHS repeat-associated protein
MTGAPRRLAFGLTHRFCGRSYYPTYDGNGNISEYLTPTGLVAAHFEYDPFGNTVINTDASNLFTYKFSTKPQDVENGLYYYGYRYYDAVAGRWINKDPIGEEGGFNLCGFVNNNGVNSWDRLGLRIIWESVDRTTAVRNQSLIQSSINGHIGVMKLKGRLASYPSDCPSQPKLGDTVTVTLDPIYDNVIANMYPTGFFALGGVLVRMYFTGTVDYDCCKKKSVKYTLVLQASFTDDFDGFIPWIDDGWTDTGATFQGSWLTVYNGSF